jgi:hypothetical protein
MPPFIAAELNHGGLLPWAQEMRSLQILTHQMPAFVQVIWPIDRHRAAALGTLAPTHKQRVR